MRARLALTALVAIAVCGCGKSQPARHVVTTTTASPAVPAATYPAQATQNTTRIASADPVAVAAAVAQIVFPSVDRGSRPAAVVLVDRRDWRAGIAASVLSAPPLRAPILLTDGAAIPPATQQALARLRPAGARALHGVQVIRIGRAPAPPGLRSIALRGRGPTGLDGQIAALSASLATTPPSAVMIVSADRPEFAMPAAALAAQSGVPILLSAQDALAPATRAALTALNDPPAYVVGPSSAISGQVVKALRALGGVTRIAGRTPSGTSVAFARYVDPRFGWGVARPGHGLVFAPAGGDPQLAAATAALSTSGSFGPLILLGDPQLLDDSIDGYLRDIEPHATGSPAHGLYNHAWIVGDEAAVSEALQAQIDRLLEITPSHE